MKFEPLEVVDKPFYFGIGGVGDFLLLMASFYDDIESDTDVIFVCNNVNTIRDIMKQFPKIHRSWLYPMNAFEKSRDMWNLIVRHKLCRGTGATPCEFKYIEDWIECGRHTVFKYYGIKRNPNWCSKIENSYDMHITIQPNGGIDSNRISNISKEELKKIVDYIPNKYNIYLIGSKSDVEKYGIIDSTRWITDFDQAFDKIRRAEFHIGVNSWCKTYSGLAGIKTYIYPSLYRIEPLNLFGCVNDPSDYVFLKQGGWDFKDWSEYAID